MKKVFTYLVRGLAVIGLFAVIGAASSVAFLAFRAPPELPDEIVLTLDLVRPVPETEGGGPLDLVLGEDEGMGLRDVLRALDYAAKDARVKGVVTDFGGNAFSLAAAQELREAVLKLRAAGKPAYAFSASYGEFGPADNAYYLAAAAGQVWLQPEGLLGITGPATHMPFLRGALDKAGVTAEFMRRGEYKTTADMFTEYEFTAANADMLGSVLDDLSFQYADGAEEDRGIPPKDWFSLVDGAPLTAYEARAGGLIDVIGYRDQLMEEIFSKLGEKAEDVTAQDYLSRRKGELKKSTGKGTPRAALIEVVGEIAQDSGGLPGHGRLVSARETADAIMEAAFDPGIEAILLRMDSPGGSAVASETLRRALEWAQMRGRPVVVSMGGMAGSGAYWIAAQADWIFAGPATLTGSIGVIAGKISGTGIWDRLGVNWGRIARGENADLWTLTAPFTPPQRARVDQIVQGLYEAFKRRVADGRGLDLQDVEAAAKGRVWTGRQALDLGLIDRLGGFDDAISHTKSLMGVAEDQRIVLQSFPGPEPVAKRISRLLERFGGVEASLDKLSQLGAFFEKVFAPALEMLDPVPRLRMTRI